MIQIFQLSDRICCLKWRNIFFVFHQEFVRRTKKRFFKFVTAKPLVVVKRFSLISKLIKFGNLSCSKPAHDSNWLSKDKTSLLKRQLEFSYDSNSTFLNEVVRFQRPFEDDCYSNWAFEDTVTVVNRNEKFHLRPVSKSKEISNDLTIEPNVNDCSTNRQNANEQTIQFEKYPLNFCKEKKKWTRRWWEKKKISIKPVRRFQTGVGMCKAVTRFS